MIDATPRLESTGDASAPAALADDALLARLRAGDGSAFAHLMRRYNQRLFRIARSILRNDADAEDAVQEAYVAAYRGLSDLAPPQRVGAWLARIATNEALMRLRRRRGSGEHAALDDLPDEPVADRAQEPAPVTEREAARVLVEAAIDRLPDGFRAVFVLRDVQQLGIAETAACLGLQAATVKTRLHRARGMLRRDLVARLSVHGSHAFEFDGARCDRLVLGVLRRLGLAAA